MCPSAPMWERGAQGGLAFSGLPPSSHKEGPPAHEAWPPHLRRQSVRVVVPDTWLSPLTTLLSLPGLSGQKGVEEPGRSRLMSQKGSMVVETPLGASRGTCDQGRLCGQQSDKAPESLGGESTYWHTWQVTSDCSPPVKIWSMIQLQWFGLLAFFPLSSPGETTAL